MVIIGADHTGYDLKEKVINYLKNKNIMIRDVSNNPKDDNDDYPDIANAICNNVLNSNDNLGIAICGTGIGISIACNKIKGIRAALCTNEDMAEFSKKHNNANVICFGARLRESTDTEIFRMLDKFFNTEFENGRHQRRLDKIIKIESGN